MFLKEEKDKDNIKETINSVMMERKERESNMEREKVGRKVMMREMKEGK